MGLASNVEAKLKQIAQKAGAAHVDVGFMSEARYGDSDSGLPVAMVAFWNEFGTKGRAMGDQPHPDAIAEGERRAPEMVGGAPPRPFFRQMIAAHRDEWPGQLKQTLVSEKGDGTKALEFVGNAIKEELEQSIRDFTTPALAASTIRRKGFAKPLIDSGKMLESVTSKVSV